jgi:hypothetical protein
MVNNSTNINETSNTSDYKSLNTRKTLSVDYSISVQYYSRGKHVYFMEIDMLIRICGYIYQLCKLYHDYELSFTLLLHCPYLCCHYFFVIVCAFLSGCESVSGFYRLFIYALLSEVQSSRGGGMRSR